MHISVNMPIDALRMNLENFSGTCVTSCSYMCTDLKVILIVNLYPFRMIETSYSDIICDWIWKTDRIVTLALFHVIGLANGYTCTVHIHSAISRLG